MPTKVSNPPKIENLALSEIAPYEKNPRDNAPAVDAVAKSIEDYGFLVPIIVDKDGVIVAGHTRYIASQKLGLDEVPVIRAEHLTEEQAKAFRLIDNKTSELATWDFDLLAEEIGSLAESGLDLVPFGWTKEEVDCLSQIVADDCVNEMSDDFDPSTKQQGADGLTGAINSGNNDPSVSKDPKSIRVAIGEVNFFVDVQMYREWVHEVRKRNDFDMQKVIDDLAGCLGLKPRRVKRTASSKETPVSDDAASDEAPEKAQPVSSTRKRERVRRPLKDKAATTRTRNRPKSPEQTLRDAVSETEA